MIQDGVRRAAGRSPRASIDDEPVGQLFGLDAQPTKAADQCPDPVALFYAQLPGAPHDQPAAVLEATFAPRKVDSPEGDGYLIVPVSKWAENLGEFLIFDTDDITAGPICRIELPFRMGWTPHGHWMDFRDNPGSNGHVNSHATKHQPIVTPERSIA